MTLKQQLNIYVAKLASLPLVIPDINANDHIKFAIKPVAHFSHKNMLPKMKEEQNKNKQTKKLC